jgi:hypothetical protein
VVERADRSAITNGRWFGGNGAAARTNLEPASRKSVRNICVGIGSGDVGVPELTVVKALVA